MSLIIWVRNIDIVSILALSTQLYFAPVSNFNPSERHKLRQVSTVATGFRPPSATVVSAEPFSHGTGTLRCLQKEMATDRHWSVSLWQDPDDVSHCRILSKSWQNWMAAYLGYTLQMKTLFRGWPAMVHDPHTRRRIRRRLVGWIITPNFTKITQTIFAVILLTARQTETLMQTGPIHITSLTGTDNRIKSQLQW